jgi:glutaryl-CoA dehydrogenase
MPRSTDPAPTDLLRVDDELTDEERLVRDTVRKFANDRILPHIADWFEAGTLPRELMPELGQLRGHGRGRLRRGLPRAGGR